MNFSLKDFKQIHIFTLFALLCLAPLTSFADKKVLSPRVDPPFWWTGMNQTSVELVFYGPQMGGMQVSLSAPNTKISRVTRPSNPNYLFVEITISADQLPGVIDFVFTSGKKKTFKVPYSIKARSKSPEKGIDQTDVMYLIMPDRFSNGDPKNDAISTMNENICDRNQLKTRHGGDIQGVINHLDYIADLGVTALWLNPVLENNQPKESYHGYAATDLYKIDPRFGDNDLFKTLVDKSHEKGMKVVWDVVYNHWGNENWMFTDLPDSSWVHWFPKFTRTNYRAETLLDPYGSEYDRKLNSNAWFDHHMPDLDQTNSQLARYLIQNSIWWIEYAGLDAFRIDTYAYPDQRFMSDLNAAILFEYPDFFIFGETMVQGSPIQAWFTRDNNLNKSFSSHLMGVTDFQLYYAMTKGFNEGFGWEEGLRRIELTLSHDILYEDPGNNVTFLDNHDLSRWYSVINEDYAKWKMGIAMIYTLRGIPCIYYGSEILMKNYCNPDGLVREDFPGGWPTDTINKYNRNGRNEKENQAFDFFHQLTNWRKQNEWLASSKMVQFVPEENTYVYFRMSEGHTLMCAFNLNEKEIHIDRKRFDECLKGHHQAREIIESKRTIIGDSITLPGKSVGIYELN